MGGVEVHLLTVLRHLSRSDYDPVVILPPGARPLPLGPAIAELGIPVYYQPLLQRLDLHAFRGVVGRLHQLAPHIVHVHLPWTFDNRWMFLAARIARCPILVSTEHERPKPGFMDRSAYVS